MHAQLGPLTVKHYIDGLTLTIVKQGIRLPFKSAFRSEYL